MRNSRNQLNKPSRSQRLAATGATEKGLQESEARPQVSTGSSSANPVQPNSETVTATVASSIPQTLKGPSNTSSDPTSRTDPETSQSRPEIMLNRLSVSTTLHTSGSRTNSGSAARSQPQAVASSSQSSASTLSAVSKPDIKDEDDDDIVIVDSCASGPPKYLTPLPEGRRKELETFPEFVTSVDKPAVFTRAFLSATLGGGTQSLIDRAATTLGQGPQN
ncbi:hypothetical protein MVEN_01530800 [Mycena venus]|uniref:Uncharacterized protein n=1 Tax=Mycena venus TaxID=2733690 RepID=A0A8H6XWV6_9AGAR|nr:hypothetical protein MVEN_01530800 [Mycena venus]